MRKKVVIAIVIIAVLLVGVGALFAVTELPNMMSTRSFEAVVQESAAQQGAIFSLTVQKTTEVYGDPICALHIGDETKLIGADGESISVTDIPPGATVKATLRDSFVEGDPIYYPDVFEIKVLG